jgi:hypothetical protein
MARIIIHHEVKDYDSWRKVFDGAEGMRREGGETDAKVFQAVDNPNRVTAILEYSSLDAARAWFSNDDLKAKMREAGVVGPPTIHYLAEA